MPDRPNIILLVGEDAGRALACHGDPDAVTPNLDRLAAEGCRYDNAFSTAPVCAPSRSTMIMGRYAWAMGSHHMRSKLLAPPRLFTHELRDAGYYVSWPTKLDLNFDPDESFRDDADHWLDRLRNGAFGDQPFFLYRNFGVTHESTMWPEAWGGHGACLERRDNEQLLGSLTDPATVRVPDYLPDTPEVRADIARFYDAVAILDRQVGQVIDALDASPYRDNTLIMFIADHGRGLPREKRWCYDAGLHLACVARWPNAIQPDTVSDELVSWVDLAPTFLSLAGAPIPDDYHGRPFLGPDRADRDFVFAGRDRMDEAYDRVRVSRDQRWHYIRNFFPELPYAQRIKYMENMLTMQVLRRMNAEGTLPELARSFMAHRKPLEELYDAVNDPDMVHNLADAPDHADTLERMRTALDAHLAAHDDLGARSERQLIERGLLADQRESYRQRIEPLPDQHRLGPFPTTILEREELE